MLYQLVVKCMHVVINIVIRMLCIDLHCCKACILLCAVYSDVCHCTTLGPRLVLPYACLDVRNLIVY